MDGSSIPLLLLAVGIVAFFLEAFIPSGGIISVFASGCVIAAIAVAFVRGGPTTGVIFVCAAVILVPVALVSAFLLLPKTPIGRRLVLKSRQHADQGYVAQDRKEAELVGETGVALSPLRPSGEARIGDRRYDVVTEGEMIERGAAIEVRHVEGNRIVVREVREKSGEA